MMLAVALVLEIILAVLAWFVARKEEEHRIVAYTFGWFAIGDLLQLATNSALQYSTAPFKGGWEVLLHFSRFLLLAREFVFAAAIVHYFRQRGALLVLAVGLLAFIPTLDYPRFSGGTMRAYYVGILLMTQGIIWVYGISSIFYKRIVPTLAHLSFLLMAAVSIFLCGSAMSFMNNWYLVQSGNVVVLVAEIALYLGCMWNLKPFRSRSVL